MSNNSESSGEVIIRTNRAGVHIGTLIARNGQEIILGNARRLYIGRHGR